MVTLARSIVNDFEFGPETKHLGILPLGHTAITNYQFLPSLYAGSSMYLAENFNSIRPNFWKIPNLNCFFSNLIFIRFFTFYLIFTI